LSDIAPRVLLPCRPPSENEEGLPFPGGLQNFSFGL
jgi:hypothetical protein